MREPQPSTALRESSGFKESVSRPQNQARTFPLVPYVMKFLLFRQENFDEDDFGLCLQGFQANCRTVVDLVSAEAEPSSNSVCESAHLVPALPG